MQHKGRNWRGR